MSANPKISRFNKWTHILLLGCDSQTPGEYERSDSMIVFSVNRGGAVRLTSIMRDLWVDIPGFGMGKINAAVWNGGPELAMRVVTDYFDLPIRQYMMVNMEGMVNIIDLLGGVDVEIDEDERIFINHCAMDVQRIIHRDQIIPPIEQIGQVHLCGAQAVGHMRNRRNGADYARTARQRQVLTTIARKARTEMNLPRLFRLIRCGRKWVRTNLKLSDLARLAVRINPDRIDCFRIPAEDTYTEINGRVWRFETDYEKNRALLQAFLNSADKSKSENDD